MDKTDCFYRRKYLMETLELPSLNEIKVRLGQDLSKLVEKKIPKSLSSEVGLHTEVETGKYLWNSPSDLLIGKVCLKPPVTDKYIKALTHISILELGTVIEKKFWNEAEIKKQQELAEQEEMMRFICETEKKEMEKKIREDEQEKCNREMIQIEAEFKEKLLKELEDLESKLLAEYEQLMDNEKECLNEVWKELMKREIEKSVNELNAKWSQLMEEEKNRLYKEFDIKLEQENRKCRLQLKGERECFIENFKHLKHQLQCKNIANIMYILCTERHRCRMERETLQKTYEDKIEKLEVVVAERDVEIEKLNLDKTNKSQLLFIREECLKELLSEFQKFVNYVLRASPTQAEFLLTLENLICLKLQEEEKDETKIAESKETDQFSVLNIEKTEDDPDKFHNKYSIIREDFQQIISQDVKMSVSDMLIYEKSPEFNQKPVNGYDTESLSSSTSKVHFKAGKVLSQTNELSKSSSESPHKQNSNCIKRPNIKRPCKKPEFNIDYMALHELDHRFPIIGTRNSLELHKVEKKSLEEEQESVKINQVLRTIKRNSSESESRSEKLLTKTSFPINQSERQIKRYSSTEIQSETQVSTEMILKGSKISMHVDSLEVIQHKHEDSHSIKPAQITHISAKIDEQNPTLTSVSFKLEPSMYPECTPSAKPTISTKIQREGNYIEKPNVAAVIGDRSATEYMEQEEDFLCYRTKSLMRILRKHPSITRLFTSCGK